MALAKLFRPRLLIGAALVAAAAAGAWWLGRTEPIDVRVDEARLGTVEKIVANTRAGTVKACRRARLAPSVGGQIARLPVTEGDRVERGQLLLELWNQDLEAELLLAQGETEKAEASARATCLKAQEAEREAGRQRTLRERGLTSEEAIDRAVTEARAGAADCAAARHERTVREARLAVIRAELAKTRLTAPFDGVVAEINGELHEFVTPSPIGIQTPPAVDLIDTRCFYVTAPIDEVDVAEVEPGQPARITLDAFGDRHFPGTVRRIADYVLEYEKQARTVDVEVEFAPAVDTRLLAGYSADVEVVVDRREGTLRVPTEAIVQDADARAVYVFHREPGVLERRPIETGIGNWDHTEVLDGLEAGERIVTSVGREGIADGVPARIEPQEAE